MWSELNLPLPRLDGFPRLDTLPRFCALLRDAVRTLRYSLQFSPEAASAFEREKRGERIAHYHITMLVAALLYNSFLVADYISLRQRFGISLTTRLGFVDPLAIFCYLIFTRVGPRAREALLAVSALPGMLGVLIIYNGSATLVPIGQVALILMMMYAINAMWPLFKYACATLFLVALGDTVFLAVNPALDASRAFVFICLIWASAQLSLLGCYLLERERRSGYLLRLRVESQNTELVQLSMIDPLTGIPNRRCLDAELRVRWQQCIHRGQPISALMIDLDRFKRLNDQYGHAYGDAVLCQVAKTIRESLRGERDMVARYGGEEFIAILPNLTLAQAIAIAKRLCAAVRNAVLPPVSGGRTVHTTISIGVATVSPTPGSSLTGLLVAADTALYEAKANGRDCVRPEAVEGE